MIVHIEWKTVYRYTQPVRQLHSEVCLLPGDRPSGQKLLHGTVATTPDAEARPYMDIFGNTVHHLDFVQPVDHLSVHVQAEVQSGMGHEPEHRLPPLLEHLYLQPTPRAPHEHEDVRLFAREFDWHGSDALRTSARLNEFLPKRLRFVVGATEVSATAVDFLQAGAGVCQDYAHLFIAMLRARRIPARYVSGYLANASGEINADASHAWVQVLVDGVWHGFDPANGSPQDERYVITAVGRDYDDIPPVRGTYRGTASEEWTTSVRIAAAS